MTHTQASLFDDGDAPGSTGNLPAPTTGARPTDRKAKALDRLLARVDELRRQVEERKRSLEAALVVHAAELRPRMQQVTDLRRDIVRALWPFTSGRQIKAADRHALRDVIAGQIDMIVSRDLSPEPDIQAIFEQVHGVSWDDAVRDGLYEAQAMMAEAFDDLGLDVDVPELRPDMTEAEMAAIGARMAERLQQVEAEHAERERARPPGKREAQRLARDEERRRRVEQMRKVSIVASYRRLVKALHPDREADPVARERKEAAMRDVTTAYGSNDVLALLRLERTWLGDGPIDAGGQADADTQDAYTQLLKTQLDELGREYETLHMHPRYEVLIGENPFSVPTVGVVRSEVAQLDALIDGMRATLEALTGDAASALAVVRDVVGEQKAASRRHARMERAVFGASPFDTGGFPTPPDGPRSRKGRTPRRTSRKRRS
jgi:hypothetical protein